MKAWFSEHGLTALLVAAALVCWISGRALTTQPGSDCAGACIVLIGSKYLIERGSPMSKE